ncbi:MAG: T9SS type A sorting domain-containing protein, partial [Bacteroidales bacterium]|nr:T9SS type A sorting domain-containing protein [Bacteroidales bacterium]
CDLVTEFTENFDFVTTPALPSCWFKVGTGTVNTQTHNNLSTPNCLHLYSSSPTSVATVAMQKVSNAGANTHYLKFKARAYYTNGTIIEVGYLTDQSDASSFVLLSSETLTTSYEEYMVYPGTAPGANGHLAFRASIPAYSLLIDDVEWAVMPAGCPTPTSLFADNITSSSATLNWTENGSSVNWNLKVSSSDTFDPTTETADIFDGVANGSPHAISGLDANTTYYCYVQNDCGIGDISDWSARSLFTTECAINTPDFMEDFTNDNPECWTQFAGILAAPTIIITGATTNWIADGFANVGTTGAAKLNIYNTTRKDWLVSPSIDLGDGSTPYLLLFDLALTDFNMISAADMDGTDDKFAVVISTDNGTTWSSANALRLWNNTGSPYVYNNIATTGENVVIDLSTYSGIVKIGFYGESTISNADNDLFIDNFAVRSAYDENDILSFIFAEQTGPATISATNHTIDIEVAMYTDPTTLVPTFTISDYATVDFASGVVHDFSAPVTYTVTSESGIVQPWVVNTTISTTQSSENDIMSFNLAEQTSPTIIDTENHTVEIEVTWNIPFTSLTPIITVSILATINPASGVSQDFTAPFTYTVTAEDGTPQDWLVTVINAEPPAGVSCSNPIIIEQSSLPYSEFEGSNCGFENTYSGTELVFYDHGEDIIYRLDITIPSTVIIEMTSHNEDLTGIAIFDDCPDVGTSLEQSTLGVNTQGQTHSMEIELIAGSYYIMIDTWAGPNCITDYDFSIRFAPKPINVIDLNSEVENVLVCLGTNEAEAIGLLASQIVITNTENIEFTVDLTWTIPSFDGNTAADYTATGTFMLPDGVVQTSTPTILEVSATVTVNALPVLICPENFTVTEEETVTLDATPEGGTYSGIGVTDNSFNPSSLENGEYTITYTYTDGTTECYNSCDFIITVNVPNSINSNETAEISIYPNPNNGLFNLSFGNVNGKVNYQIYDIKGRVIINKDIQTNGETIEEVSLDLTSGVYFVRIITETQTLVQKLVIE